MVEAQAVKVQVIVKFSQSKKDKVPRRQFLNSNPLRDWVGLLGCFFAAASAYQEISYNYFTVDGTATTQAFDGTWDGFFETLIGGSIDGTIQSGVSFGLVVLVVGGIRKLVSSKSELLEVSDKKSKGWRISTLIVLATVLGFFSAYIGAFNNQEDNSNTKINQILSGLKPVPLNCRLIGEDELCVSGLQNGETASLNFKVTYAEAWAFEPYQIRSSSFAAYIDCSTDSVSVSKIELYDLKGAKVALTKSIEDSVKIEVEKNLLSDLLRAGC